MIETMEDTIAKEIENTEKEMKMADQENADTSWQHWKYIYLWSNSHWKQAEGPQNNTFTTKAVKKDPQSQAEKEEKQSSWNLPLRMKQSMEGKYTDLDILSGK